MQQPRRPCKPVDRALLQLIGWLGEIDFAAGITGALVSGQAWPAVLGVALFAFGVAFPQIVMRIFRRY